MSDACCMPDRGSVPPADVAAPTGHAADAGPRHSIDQCPIAGGTFVMGDAHGDGLPADGELPLHTIELAGYVIDEAAVTTADFATFIDATGYRTSAERAGTSAVFGALVADGSSVIGRAPATPWWLEVRGADWAHPEGPGSDIDTRSDHPVVHISFVDAQAYCDWAGRSLPTEAQWEYAARGGLHSARFPWGDELVDASGVARCSIYAPDVWGAPFPAESGSGVGVVPTTPVRSFAPNGFGLWQMVGNVWEWTASDFVPFPGFAADPYADYSQPWFGTRKVLRGGGFATSTRIARPAYRNFFTPERNDVIAGFRTCAV